MVQQNTKLGLKAYKKWAEGQNMALKGSSYPLIEILFILYILFINMIKSNLGSTFILSSQDQAILLFIAIY